MVVTLRAKMQVVSKACPGVPLSRGDRWLTSDDEEPLEATSDPENGADIHTQTPPTVHQMILRLEQAGLISRVPGKPRSIQILVSEEEIPRLI
jgi:repressor LexA